MKFEIKQFIDYYKYLTIYYKKDNEENYTRLPLMLNIDLATKEDIISFIEWVDKRINPEV